MGGDYGYGELGDGQRGKGAVMRMNWYGVGHGETYYYDASKDDLDQGEMFSIGRHYYYGVGGRLFTFE